MEEMVKFFIELLKMMSSMVEDIMPDILLHVDQDTLENLTSQSQEACTSLQVFAKLCSIISKRNLTCSSSTLTVEAIETVDQKPEEETGTVKEDKPERSGLVGDDNKSVVTNFSDVTTQDDSVWKALLDEAREWYSLCSNGPIPQVYYCGICDKQAKAKHIWECHLNGKNHLRLSEDVAPLKFVCETCGLVLTGEGDFINLVIDSDEHMAFDALICDIRAPLDMKSDSSVPASSKSGVSVQADERVATSKPKAKLGKVIFQFTEIHPDFVRITNTIAQYIDNHEEYAIGYCRPCEAVCESKQAWNAHKRTSKHLAKMSSKCFKNVLCRCLQCEFVVTANLKMATVYMKYHIEHCHHQSTLGIKLDEYMDIKNLSVSGNKKEPSSQATSFKGSSETVGSGPSCAVNKSSSLESCTIGVDGMSVKAPAHEGALSSAPAPITRNGESSSCVMLHQDGCQRGEPLAGGNSESSGSLKRTSSNPYSRKSSLGFKAKSNHEELQPGKPVVRYIKSLFSESVGNESSN